MPNAIEKVTAFITRSAPDGASLLLFEHPRAGIQIPAGTVEVGETPEAAARREAAEETGLTSLALRRVLGTIAETLPPHERVICKMTTVFARPDRSSFDWATLPRGATITVDMLTLTTRSTSLIKLRAGCLPIGWLRSADGTSSTSNITEHSLRLGGLKPTTIASICFGRG